MGNLLSKPKMPPLPPAAPSPPVIPLPDDLAIQQKKKKAFAEQSKKSGRASTFLTDDNGSFG